MKVFISWSKSLSQECAEILRNWIKCTLQASKPWMSSEDLDKGTVWFDGIGNELNDTTIGIICLTKENKNNPWILFESGALAKGLAEKRVYTLLIDLESQDIEPPLSQFNHTSPNRVDMKKLLVSINKQLGEQALEEKVLDDVFNTYWPQFDETFKAAIKHHPVNLIEEKKVRSSDDILSEILNTTRNLDKRMRHIESNRGNLTSASQNYFGATYDTIDIVNKVESLISKGFSAEDIAGKLIGLATKDELMNIANSLILNSDKRSSSQKRFLRGVDGQLIIKE
jgi:hypothetical protein